MQLIKIDKIFYFVPARGFTSLPAYLATHVLAPRQHDCLLVFFKLKLDLLQKFSCK